jgi:hypothetical protein
MRGRRIDFEKMLVVVEYGNVWVDWRDWKDIADESRKGGS